MDVEGTAVTALHIILVIAHLIGMAAILGGALEQWRAGSRAITSVMVWGARAQLVTGLALVGLAEARDVELDYWKITVKLAVALAVAATAEIGAKRARKAFFPALAALTTLNVIVAVAW